MNKANSTDTLTGLGSVSKLFWKTDNLSRRERFAFYIRDDQIMAFLYGLTEGGIPGSVISVAQISSREIQAVRNAQSDQGDLDGLIELNKQHGRTYKVIKSFDFSPRIYLLLEQRPDRADAIAVGEAEDRNRKRTITLKARVQPRQPHNLN